uniref:Heparanase-like protein 3 n=1 Tax=Zea mays TaxID=4577 RepID=A0A804NWT1_MAIZE
MLATREEYHLAPKDGDLQSQQVLLNGHVLATDADGDIPELEPVRVDGTQPVTVVRINPGERRSLFACPCVK